MTGLLIESASDRDRGPEAGTVITMDNGIPGFPELCEVAITPIDEYNMFVWISAHTDQGVAFLAVNPFFYFPEYVVEVSDADEAALLVTPGDDLIVYCLVTIDREAAQSGSNVATANLVAPIVINVTRAVALQVILEGENELRAMLANADTSVPR